MNYPYGRGPRDLMVYNLQYTVVDRLITKLYRTIDVNEDSYIITERRDHPTIHPKFRNNNIQANIIILDDLKENIRKLSGAIKIYYVFVPQLHDPKEGLGKIREYFEIKKKHKIEIDGYHIDAYTLRLKEAHLTETI